MNEMRMNAKVSARRMQLILSQLLNEKGESSTLFDVVLCAVFCFRANKFPDESNATKQALIIGFRDCFSVLFCSFSRIALASPRYMFFYSPILFAPALLTFFSF